MMDGKNCTGRKISLLNDSSDPAGVLAKVQLPLLTAHSRSPSCASTPSLSPQTPHLSRSSSTSDSRSFATPSPLTPSLHSFDHAAHNGVSSASYSAHHSHHHSPHQPQQHHGHHPQSHSHRQQYFLVQPPYGKMDEQKHSMYPPIPDPAGGPALAYAMPAQLTQPVVQAPVAQPTFEASNSPASEPSLVSSVSAASNSKPQPKKNQYPCPMAKQFNCNDYFTTSGHAARHAKKHTGKKDAFCPECNKAFTRKDNMEQHRRTHQTGRGASRSTTDDAKVKKATKQPVKKVGLKAEPGLEAAVEQHLAAQQSEVQTVAQAVAHAQAQQAAAQQQQAVEQAMLLHPAGPYFIGGIDPGPIPALPNVMPELNIRPSLHRSTFANSLDFVAPIAPMGDPESLHYSYPSPGLSNGLNSLALAASEHRRMSEEKMRRSPTSDSSSQETP